MLSLPGCAALRSAVQVKLCTEMVASDVELVVDVKNSINSHVSNSSAHGRSASTLQVVAFVDC